MMRHGNVNGVVREPDTGPDTLLWWTLRDELELTGKPFRSLPIRLES